jgi:hypothetical protein
VSALGWLATIAGALVGWASLTFLGWWGLLVCVPVCVVFGIASAEIERRRP